MKTKRRRPAISVCVLTYGDHLDLVSRCLESVVAAGKRDDYCLIVGANAVSTASKRYLRNLRAKGVIDRLHLSTRNINKCPMMRRMFEKVRTEFICWLDDDSYFTEAGALDFYLEKARTSPDATAIWGRVAVCNFPHDFIDVPDVVTWVRAASWYRQLTPPSWDPGGKGEFDYDECGTGDGRWIFVVGGFWFVRTRAIRALDWPDRRLIKLGDDVLLGEALRQHGWDYAHTDARGVAVNTAPRRGEVGELQRRRSTGSRSTDKRSPSSVRPGRRQAPLRFA
jgi:GT2 family glycosyltransferase